MISSTSPFPQLVSGSSPVRRISGNAINSPKDPSIHPPLTPTQDTRHVWDPPRLREASTPQTPASGPQVDAGRMGWNLLYIHLLRKPKGFNKDPKKCTLQGYGSHILPNGKKAKTPIKNGTKLRSRIRFQTTTCWLGGCVSSLEGT